MRVFIFIYNVMNIYGFVLRDTYNLLPKDRADYNIDLVIDEDDYEMINKNQQQYLSVDKKQFEELDKLANIEYTRSTTIKSDVSLYKDVMVTNNRLLLFTNPNYNVIITTYLGYRGTHDGVFKKRETTKPISPVDYNYNQLLNEYYDLGDKEVIWQDQDTKEHYDFASVVKSIFISGHKIDYSNKSIGFQAMKCLVNDYKNQQCPTNEVITRFSRIILIWFLVYMAVAVPLWCTRGWCCCCLFCKFFKPRKTIDEAKKYLVSNPPGVFKTKSREIHYYPTVREKETYEEFEHFIKTL